MREVLKVYVPIALLVTAVVVVALRFVAPPPPREIRIAAGQAGGFYQQTAAKYRGRLAQEDIAARIVETDGSVENLRRLAAGEVDVALVQGGIAGAETAPDLMALAGVFFEPVWVLVRSPVRAARLAELRGRRIAVGAPESGTRVLALQLLEANDIDAGSATLVEIGTTPALSALGTGEIDAAIIVAAEPPATMVQLLAGGVVRLLSFPHAEAYTMRFPFLSAVRLPAGAVSLPRNIPATETMLVAPTAALVVHKDIHPAFVNLLLKIAREIHGGTQLFARAGAFPTRERLDLPLHEDAARFHERGPSFLFRYLPFGIAVWLERMLVVLIPLVTLLLPIMRFAPPAYRWQVQRKIYRWYKRIRRLEADAESSDESGRAAIRAELDDIQQRLAAVKVPAAYAQQLYELRIHLDFVRARLRSA